MLMDLQEGNKKLKDLNRGQLQVIRNMAASNSSVKFKAQSILSFVLGETYPDVIEKFGSNVTGSNPDMLQQKPVISNTSSLAISPNPATQSINLSFPDTDITDNVQITVMDILGKQMSVSLLNKTSNSYSIDVSTLANGTYLCTLFVNDKATLSNKFTIIK